MSSCDTFVALPPATDGCIIFGKNSDRPPNEVQEVIHMPAADHDNGATVQCTYLEIPQAAHTHAVVLSKPAWMWGAEMGANQHGVCVGNEAVWTKMASEEDKEEKLLGMDLVRLGLERGASAQEALGVITDLLATHGQGGPCYEDKNKMDVVYHNSFIIADGSEAWVLETAGKEWAAQNITSGTRNLSNLLTIGTDYERSSSSLHEQAKSAGLWGGDGDLHFADTFTATPPSGMSCPGAESPHHRYTAGKQLLDKHPERGFDTLAMMGVLRDEESGICRLGRVGSATVASQVSVLYPPDSGKPGCHWLTGTPNPNRSVFKPFVFTADVTVPSLTASPTFQDDPAKTRPRFERLVDRAHPLYAAHRRINPLDDNFQHEPLRALLRGLEEGCVREVGEFMAQYDTSRENELHGLFADVVETEMKFYPTKQ